MKDHEHRYFRDFKPSHLDLVRCPKKQNNATSNLEPSIKIKTKVTNECHNDFSYDSPMNLSYDFPMVWECLRKLKEVYIGLWNIVSISLPVLEASTSSRIDQKAKY